MASVKGFRAGPMLGPLIGLIAVGALFAILERINTPDKMIITVEDPIEFIHRHQGCIVNQREVGTDTKSYARGLRGALRQLPHVIFVGEMRDLTSMSMALTAAETGNLVISTMATQECCWWSAHRPQS